MFGPRRPMSDRAIIKPLVFASYVLQLTAYSRAKTVLIHQQPTKTILQRTYTIIMLASASVEDTDAEDNPSGNLTESVIIQENEDAPVVWIEI